MKKIKSIGESTLPCGTHCFGLMGELNTPSSFVHGYYSQVMLLSILMKQTLGSFDLPPVLEQRGLYRTDGKRPDGVTRIWDSLPEPILPNLAKCPYLAHFAELIFSKVGNEIRQSGHRNSAEWARQLCTSAKTDFLKAKI